MGEGAGGIEAWEMYHSKLVGLSFTNTEVKTGSITYYAREYFGTSSSSRAGD